MKNLLFILILLSISNSKAQNPAIVWQKTYGGNLNDYSSDILRVESTNELIIVGSSRSNVSGEKTENCYGKLNIWILKTDESGTIIWDKTIGGSESDGAITRMILKDNLIYILSTSNSPVSGNKLGINYGAVDYWLICMNLEGDILWDKTYGGDERDGAKGIRELENGNLLLYGESRSNKSGNKSSDLIGTSDLWILEVSPIDGNIIQQKNIGTENFNSIISANTDQFGNIYICGEAMLGVSGDKTDVGYGGSDLWMIKLDAGFNILADKCFGGDGMDYSLLGGDLIVQSGALYLVANSESGISGNKTTPNYGYQDYWILKLDFDLNLIWDRTFGGNDFDYVSSVIAQPSGKIVVFGESVSAVSGNKTAINYSIEMDIWLIIIDEDGNEVRQETYGGLMNDVVSGVVGDDHGNLFILASSDSDVGGLKSENSRGEMDYWLLKLDASDFLSIPKHADDLFLAVYPNPFQDIVHFNFGEHHEPIQLSIYTIDGQRVFHQEFSPGINSFDWQTTATTTAVYIFEVITTHTIRTGKIIRGN